jgi:hypothetical protein
MFLTAYFLCFYFGSDTYPHVPAKFLTGRLKYRREQREQIKTSRQTLPAI